MKKMLSWLLTLILLFCLAACTSQPKENFTSKDQESKNESFIPDITMEEIEWSVGSGIVKGENYVLLEYTNNSQYTINSFELKFIEKPSVSAYTNE